MLRNLIKFAINDCIRAPPFTKSYSTTIGSAGTIKLPVSFNHNINNSWIWQHNQSIETPPTKSPLKSTLDLPSGLTWTPMEDSKSLVIEKTDPTMNALIPLEAARLIVIRRIKMNKHKLKKLRKRMKFEWAKKRQRRELKKEKLFQAQLIAQIKTAEAFCAADYVNEKLRAAREGPLPPPDYINPMSLGGRK